MRTLSRLALSLGLSTVAACAGTMHTTQSPQSLVARLDPNGVSAPQRSVESGGILRFENDDVRPHEIYSNDCPELASALIPPGQTFAARVDQGPKTCHFQDLLAPSAAYLRMLATGLCEAHGWDIPRVADYLATCPGAAGTWTAESIATTLATLDGPETSPA